ncbi:RCC1 domain-containing protein [Vulgatibacter incomptus]|nr:hypothetical protein [Vulgatibacter incomptus]
MGRLERWAVVFCLSLGACVGEAPREPETNGETLHLEGLTASTDEVDAVRLAWSSPDRALSAITVKRDGVPVATLPGDATSFEDRAATPGGLGAPVVTLEPLEDSVRLEWQAPPVFPGASHSYEVVAAYPEGTASASAMGLRRAPLITGFLIERDGRGLASVGPVSTYDDASAAPGGLGAPALTVRETGDALVLDWVAPSASPGEAHSYRVLAESDLGSGPPSANVVGGRSAPSITGYRIERDGEELAVADADTRSRSDESASPGSIGAPTLWVVASTAAAGLSWDRPRGERGSSHEYIVVAVTETQSALSNPVSASRSAPVITGYSVLRDGAEIALLDVAATSYADTTAMPGELGPPASVTATQGTRTDAVEVSWRVPAIGAPPHAYAVVASTSAGIRASANVVGGRAAADVIGYEVRRDDGEWMGAGDATSFVDFDAPGFELTAAAVATSDNFGNYVELRLEADPEFGPPAPSQYEVRAITADGPGEASPIVVGYRGFTSVGSGGLSYQWQRSTRDADEAYEDLPGFIDSGEIDREPLLDDGRYYRVEVRSEGAIGWSTAARAVVPSFDSISTGSSHTCAVRSDHKLFCWGSNTFRQSTVPAGTDAFESVSAGVYHTCAVRRGDGRAICWGSNGDGESQAPPSESFASVSGGRYFTCGVRAGDGTVVCWGDNGSNQLQAPSGVSFLSVSAGYSHACGIRASDRKVLCWGDNYGGMAPPGPSADAFESVSAGSTYTCGVRSRDRKMVCWGSNTPDTGADSFETISVWGAACGVRTVDRKVVCMKPDNLGRGETTTETSFGAYESVSAGYSHFCALRYPDRRVVCWGDGPSGETPVIRSLDTFDSVSAGLTTSCAVRRVDHRVVCWGNTGGLPAGPWADPVESVSVGNNHVCALRSSDHSVVCEGGYASSGEATVPSPGPWKSFTARHYQTCAIRSADGRVVCWGDNRYGQAPAEPSVNTFTSVSTGFSHTCGIRAIDQKISCWGRNDKGQAPDTPSTDPFRIVSAADDHTCGVRSSDDKVVCWGDNSKGQAPPGPSADSFYRLSTGWDFTCGIRSRDRKVLCWGRNTNVQVPSGPSLDSFDDVSAGYDHACGVRSDGRVICWGTGSKGSANVVRP